jgi:hypothetical protein
MVIETFCFLHVPPYHSFCDRRRHSGRRYSSLERVNSFRTDCRVEFSDLMRISGVPVRSINENHNWVKVLRNKRGREEEVDETPGKRRFSAQHRSAVEQKHFQSMQSQEYAEEPLPLYARWLPDQSWSGSMRCVLGLILAMSVSGIIPASSEATELGVSLASRDNAITVGSNSRPDDGRNMALIKEEEFESPEMIAVIQRNREDRERTVVMDR